MSCVCRCASMLAFPSMQVARQPLPIRLNISLLIYLHHFPCTQPRQQLSDAMLEAISEDEETEHVPDSPVAKTFRICSFNAFRGTRSKLKFPFEHAWFREFVRSTGYLFLGCHLYHLSCTRTTPSRRHFQSRRLARFLYRMNPQTKPRP